MYVVLNLLKVNPPELVSSFSGGYVGRGVIFYALITYNFIPGCKSSETLIGMS